MNSHIIEDFLLARRDKVCVTASAGFPNMESKQINLPPKREQLFTVNLNGIYNIFTWLRSGWGTWLQSSLQMGLSILLMLSGNLCLS